jgi:voltage-gated potassium channel
MARAFAVRFLLIVCFAAILTATGTSGYVLIEGWHWHESLYMTVITITSVGYEEVRQLSPAGENFTMLLLTGGVTMMGLFFGLTAALLVELDLTNFLRRSRKMKELENLRDHVIVCGTGRTGRQVIQEFIDLGHPFVALEMSQTRIDELLEDYPDAIILHADATHDDKLELAGIERASSLITCLSADADNLFVCLSARALRPDLMIVARGYEEDTMSKLYHAGADHVISPNVSGAIQMASFVVRPSVMTFLDVATRSPDLSLRLEQAVLTEKSRIHGKTLAEAGIREATGLIVIALRKSDAGEHDFVFNPPAASVLEAGDTVVALGTPQQISALREYVHA